MKFKQVRSKIIDYYSVNPEESSTLQQCLKRLESEISLLRLAVRVAYRTVCDELTFQVYNDNTILVGVSLDFPETYSPEHYACALQMSFGMPQFAKSYLYSQIAFLNELGSYDLLTLKVCIQQNADKTFRGGLFNQLSSDDRPLLHYYTCLFFRYPSAPSLHGIGPEIDMDDWMIGYSKDTPVC
ncbi:MAG: hypothetical protein AAGA83_00225 [Cyanobacteria bacterium P01_F01_bin.116]